MKLRVAILTPAAAGAALYPRYGEVLARLAEPLEANGVAVEGRSWTGTDDLGGFDLVMPLIVWGYHHAGAEWTAQLDRWEQAEVRLANPASVLRWNADKAYLGRLASAGAPVTPVRYAERLTPELLLEAAEAFGTDRMVAKPQVSAGAWRTIRWSPGQSLDDGPDGPSIIQPYLPSIETDGEISLIYFGGQLSHAIRKRPQPGDFRVQPEYDGIITRHAPEPDELAAAEAVLAAIHDPLLYARVDLVRDLAGKAALMEIELVEPDLYLQYDPNGGAAFGEAVAALSIS